MPGPAERKANIFSHLKNNVKSDGQLFGATVLGKDVKHNAGGRFLINQYNKKGIFGDNWNDSAEVFTNALENAFEEVTVQIQGTVLLFTARKPKQ